MLLCKEQPIVFPCTSKIEITTNYVETCGFLQYIIISNGCIVHTYCSYCCSYFLRHPLPIQALEDLIQREKKRLERSKSKFPVLQASSLRELMDESRLSQKMDRTEIERVSCSIDHPLLFIENISKPCTLYMILFYIPCVLLALVMQLRIQIICCKLNFAFCCYASRRSCTRDTVKLTVCLFQLSLLNGCNATKTNRLFIGF